MALLKRKLDLHGNFERGEAPDFVLKRPDGTLLGVEVTEVLLEEVKRIEAKQDAIVQTARKLCIEASVPPVDVTVYFPDVPIEAKRRSLVAQRIAKLVEENCPPHGAHVRVENDWRGHWYKVGEVACLLIHRLPHVTKHEWSCGRAGYMQTQFSQLLQERIDVKAGKLPSYRTRCTECWLLLFAVGFEPSAFFDFGEDMQAHAFRSPFERTIFLSVVGERLVDLTPFQA